MRKCNEDENAAVVTEDVSMSPETYQYFLGLENRRIVINEEIGSDLVTKVILPLLDFDNDGSGEPIEILINSVGGSALDGLVLCDIIDKLKTPTTITVLGCAFSMGCIILAAGKHNPNVKKVCYPFSVALLHDGNNALMGSVGDVKDTYKFYNRLDKRIKKYILANTEITEDEYCSMERKQWYMDSECMLEKGLVDEIL